jgi:hypothetical protein
LIGWITQSYDNQYFFGGKFLHFFSLKDMILIHTKDLRAKNGPNSPDFQKQITMFLQQIPVGSPNIKGLL